MKKTRKQWMVVLLVLVMLLATACSGDSGELKQPSNQNNQPPSPTQPSGEPGGQTDEQVTLAETVLYDADGIKITATGLEEGWTGPQISILVENNTDTNILITAKDLSVNGYMMQYAGLYTEVAAGKKANDVISLSTSELEQCGIETIAQIQLYIDISDADSWETLTLSDLVTLTTSAEGFEQPVDDSGELLYEENGIKIVCKGLKQDILWDGTLVFHMENNSGQPISIYAENVSVNGFMQDVSLWSTLRNGTRMVDGMTLLDLSDLELESIDEIESIEFNLRIVNSETWDEITTTDVIVLNFE